MAVLHELQPELVSPSDKALDDRAGVAATDIDFLFRAALAKKGHKEFVELFNFVGRFPRYSIFNTLLIYLKRPGAAAVATVKQWWRRARRIVPDAIPIVLLQPRGPIMFVYELSDTSGPPIRGQRAMDPFATKGQLAERVWDKTLENALSRDRIEVECLSLGYFRAGQAVVLHSGSQAYTISADRPKQRYRVRIEKSLELPARYATLAHELAHIYCGHLGAQKGDWWPNRSSLLSRGQAELEAEATSYVVCLRAGIEKRSAEYLAQYVEPEDLEAISIDTILRAATHIESMAC
jgi:hypothetical protein